MKIEKVKEFIKPFFEYAEEFGDYIISANPSEANAASLSSLKHLSQKISKANTSFLTEKKLSHYEDVIYPLFFSWNAKLSSQLLKYHKATSEVARCSIKKLKGNFFDPLTPIFKERDRYLDAENFVTAIIKGVDKQVIDEVKLAGIFYTFIVLHEAMEYYFRKPLCDGLAKYNIEQKHPLQDIFCVDTQRKDKDGKDYADTAIIRNALSHFNYKLENKNEGNVIIFFPNDSKLTFEYSIKKFLEFISNYKFLIQSFWSILSLMVCFTQLRRHFTIRQPHKI